MTTIDKTLPRIISLTEVTSAAEFGDVNCPHCGAKGKHIYHFIVEGGERLGAMAGCIKKFPQHEFVAIHMSIMQKGGELSKWDAKIMDAIGGFANGTMDESLARRIVSNTQKDRADFMRRRYSRR